MIALPANALPEHVRATNAAGADAHLTKPVTAQALLSMVSRLTAGGAGAAASARQIPSSASA